jgi:hypothetical protein
MSGDGWTQLRNIRRTGVEDRTRRAILLLVTGLCAAALIVGVVTHGVDYGRSEPAEPIALGFAGAVGFSWARRYGACGIVLAALLAAGLLFGAGATAVLALTLLVALSLGLLAFHAPPSPAAWDLLLRIAVGLGLMVGVLQIVMHFPLNWAPCYLAAGLTVIAVAWRDLAKLIGGFLTEAGSAPPLTSKEAILAAVLFGALLATTAYATGPETGYDALTYHLAVVSKVTWYGQFHFDPVLLDRALLPQGAEWLFTWANVLGGESATKLLNVACFWLTVGMVVGLASTASEPEEVAYSPTLLALLALALTPLTNLVLSQLFQETVTTLFVTGALAALLQAWRSPRELAWSRMIFLLLGAACAAKVQALFFGGIGLMAVISLLRGFGWRTGLRHSLSGAALFAAIGVVPYAQAFIRTGNPFFPFVFGVPFDNHWVGHVTWDLLYRMVFDTGHYLESWDGAFGYQHLILIPLLLTAGLLARRGEERAVALALLLFIGAMLSQAQYVRYQFYALAGLLLLMPVAWTGLGRLGRGLLLSGLLASTLLNFLTYRTVATPDFHIAQILQPDRFAIEVPEERRIVAALNATYGIAARPYFAGVPFVAGLLGTPTTTPSQLFYEINQAGSPDEVGQALRAHGITHVVAPDGYPDMTPPHPMPPLLKRFIRERMVEVPLAFPGIRLYAFPSPKPGETG